MIVCGRCAIHRTLIRYLIEQQAAHPSATGEFTLLMAHVGIAAKMVASEVRRAGLVDILGTTGEVNVQGEAVKKLDDYANQVFLNVLEHSQLVCEVISEELAGVADLGRSISGRKYALFVDPLDGSGNTDINGPVATIFGVHLRPDVTAPDTPESDLLLRGTDQVAAGYVLYGPSTVLVLASGEGVHCFTLDPDVGEFMLTHENVRMPARGRTYSVNAGNGRQWEPGLQHYVASLQAEDPASGRPYSQRYIGALAADFHRTLLQGGIYLYPGDHRQPNGKLRLLYECAPLALVAEKAGGRASTGRERILDIVPHSIHQRVPLLIGSAEDVAAAERAIAAGEA